MSSYNNRISDPISPERKIKEETSEITQSSG